MAGSSLGLQMVMTDLGLDVLFDLLLLTTYRADYVPLFFNFAHRLKKQQLTTKISQRLIYCGHDVLE